MPWLWLLVLVFAHFLAAACLVVFTPWGHRLSGIASITHWLARAANQAHAALRRMTGALWGPRAALALGQRECARSPAAHAILPAVSTLAGPRTDQASNNHDTTPTDPVQYIELGPPVHSVPAHEQQQQWRNQQRVPPIWLEWSNISCSYAW
jgi:hypothetical protein